MTDPQSPERFAATTTAQVITGLRILSAKLHHDLDGDAFSEAADHLAALLAQRDALAAALRAWQQFFDEFDNDPADPLTRIRHQIHGKRMAVTRAALALVDAPEGT